MSEYHYGEASEVKNLGKQLLNSIKGVKELSVNASKYLQKMQEFVKDSAYDEADDIVKSVIIILKNGLDDAADVIGKLNKYADYLDSLQTK